MLGVGGGGVGSGGGIDLNTCRLHYLLYIFFAKIHVIFM